MRLALAVGAVLAVELTCLFSGNRLWTHVLVAAVLAGIVTVLLFAIYQLPDPFGGGAHVNGTAVTAALTQRH